MRFTVAGSKIICSRIDKTVDSDNRYRNVVEFDSHVDTVPPHVAAKLTRSEVIELEEFLADRQRIQKEPVAVNILEALPDLVEEVTDVLTSVNNLNNSVYERLWSSVASLADALESVRPENNGRGAPIQGMRSSEVLKERLENIKRELS